METKTLRFAGFGGQGIVKAGEILGMAAVADGKRSLQNQSYGSSARGGLCTSDVTVAEGEIYEIEPDRFDVMVILSQDSCNAFLREVKEDGVVLFEEELVKLPEGFGGTAHGIPATQIAAKELGRRIVTNMVVIGFCGAVTGLVSREALEKVIRQNVPAGTESLNLKALDQGWQRGEAIK